MKINWGTGIVIAFLLFMSFILFFVIKSSTQDQYKYDLVSEEYYKDELKYQVEIDKLNNAKSLKIEINKVDKGIEIKFPVNFNANNTDGLVSFYRPSNKVLDFKLPLEIAKNRMLISDEKLVQGNWNISIDFENNSKEYLIKKTISY
ncbi:FixH family protein [Urechidicola croceus]|uniref:Cytochrome C oxidase Cbb3 n=1 Tax=Urechidicola croceus TaxID=1850246 RepID=A0A1D8P7V3_9FLAO|nr:FixH family protein [Urechidicola croceus]AOW20655.1 cytochrome C oxidase Cbb3 [Urechidicola croceus]